MFNDFEFNYNSNHASIGTTKEYLNWLQPKYYRMIIGRNGETINQIRQRSGARIQIEGDSGCFVTGTPSQIDIAKNLIQQKVSEIERKSQTPSADPNWSRIDFVKPNMIGKVIGKNGETIKSFEEMYSVKLKSDERKLYIYGSLNQTNNVQAVEGLKELLKSHLHREKLTDISNWTHLTFVKHEMIGKVIGKRGETIKSFEKTYDVKLKTDNEKLYIFGDLLSGKNRIAVEGLKEFLKERVESESLENNADWNHIDFVKPGMLSKVVGKKGETIKSFEELYKVKLRAHNDKLYIYGDVRKIENRTAIEGLKELLKEKLEQVELSQTSNWTQIEFIKPDMMGKVIGKNGETINSFEQMYEVKLKANAGKLFIYGKLNSDKNRMAIEGLKELLSSCKTTSESSESGWEIVKNFDSKMIGKVIGKQGVTKRSYENQYRIQIKVIKRGSESFIAIKSDDEEAKHKFCIKLHTICIVKNKYIASRKVFFPVGINHITLSECDHAGLCTLNVDNPGGGSVENSFESVLGLRGSLIKGFENAKQLIQKMNGGFCDYLVHSGKIFCTKSSGKYSTNEIDWKNLKYHRLNKGELDIVKIEGLPKIKEYLRYDMSILTPKPFIRIRYKLFLEEINGRLSFISPRDAGVNENEFVMVEAKPGYISLPDYKVSSIDIVDPTSSNTLRINVNIFNDTGNEYQHELRTHLEVLNPIFDQIRILTQHLHQVIDDDMEIHIPDMPGGYVIPYMRKSVRKTYRFSGSNLLRTSEERVFRNDENYYDSGEKNVIDLFFVNQSIDDLLHDEDWEAEEVVNEFDNVLKFSDTMLQYLS